MQDKIIDESVAGQIGGLLTEALSPSFLEVIDESSLHDGHAGARPGGQTHFRVRISSPLFQGMGRVARERRVYEPLRKLLATQIHALAVEVLD